MKKILSVLLILLLFCSCGAEIKNPEEENISSGDAVLSEEEEGQKEILPLEGDCITLEDSEGLLWAKAMEFGKTIVFVNDDGTINAYNAESGEKLYTALASTGEENIFRIEKYEEKDGFDYRILLGNGVLYRNSAEPEKEFFTALPGGTVFSKGMFGNDDQSCYDINEKAFVYACEDGIMLVDVNGNNAKLVLDNKILENFKEIMTNCEYDVSALAPFEFRSPRFILGGTKIAATVVTWENIDNGFVVYDIESESIDIGRWIPEPWSPYYTVCDRYVVECGSWVYTGIYDAEAKTFTQYKEGFNSGFSYNYATYDFQNVIVVDYDNGNDDPMDYTMMRAYLCTAKNLDDRSRPFISVTDDTTECWVEAIGEKYAVIVLGGKEDKWIPKAVCAVKYSE
ncbi:MAG: hypothetical protein IJ300_12015 [Clostridia bacterium]|nr:hypothetical protein [Clostridia bacterium]MBQ8767378.1 hypothetical protein [Clostridia bacterium]